MTEKADTQKRERKKVDPKRVDAEKSGRKNWTRTKQTEDNHVWVPIPKEAQAFPTL